MRVLTKRSTTGLSVLAAITVAAFLGYFVLYSGGTESGSGLTDGTSVHGIVEWTHRDASGAVLGYSRLENATVDLIKNDARARLGVAGTTAPTSNTDLYDNITLCNTGPATGEVCTVISNVDNITENNPQSGTGAVGGTGVFSVALTFTAIGTVTVDELQLSKGSVTDGTLPTASEIGAYQDVAVTLENTDTLTVTWTVTVS